MDGGAWWAAVHGVAKSRTQLSDFTFPFHDGALREPLVRRQGSQDSMRVARGSASWLKVKSESEVIQLCLTLRDPMVCSLPGSSIHGIFQARVLEWGAIAFSRVNRTRQGLWLELKGPFL